MTPEPYQISVPQKQIDALKTKLSLAQFPNELEESGWDLGVPLTDMKRLTKAWEQWDWRQAEEKLNETPQYHIPISVDGFGELDIHFVWQKSSAKNAIPLLFVHGCMTLSFQPMSTSQNLTNKFQGPAHFWRSSQFSLYLQSLRDRHFTLSRHHCPISVSVKVPRRGGFLQLNMPKHVTN